jgi:hypothetical protein
MTHRLRRAGIVLPGVSGLVVLLAAAAEAEMTMQRSEPVHRR